MQGVGYMFGELHRCEVTRPLDVEKMIGHGPTPSYKPPTPPLRDDGCRVCRVSGEPKIPPPPIIDSMCQHKGDYADMLNFIECIYGIELNEWQCKMLKFFANSEHSKQVDLKK